MLEIDDPEMNDEKLSSIIEASAHKCCQEHNELCSSRVSISAKQLFLFIYFKEARKMKIRLNYNILGDNFKYKSHVCEVGNISCDFETHFVHDDIQFVNENGVIKLSSSTEYEENVKFLILSRVETDKENREEVNLFQTNALQSIRNRAALITNPELLQKKREYEKTFVSSGKRKKVEEQRKARDEETGRREGIEAKRKSRDEETGRRVGIEARRNATPNRKEYEAEFVSSGKRHKVEEQRKARDEETGRRVGIEAKRKARDEETGRRKGIEAKRNTTPNRKEYEAEFVSSGKRQKVEEQRKAKDKRTGRRKETEAKRNATPKRKEYQKNYQQI
jgi:hypothetical protein